MNLELVFGFIGSVVTALLGIALTKANLYRPVIRPLLKICLILDACLIAAYWALVLGMLCDLEIAFLVFRALSFGGAFDTLQWIGVGTFILAFPLDYLLRWISDRVIEAQTPPI